MLDEACSSSMRSRRAQLMSVETRGVKAATITITSDNPGLVRRC
jgi:hypothetical protein